MLLGIPNDAIPGPQRAASSDGDAAGYLRQLVIRYASPAL